MRWERDRLGPQASGAETSQDQNVKAPLPGISVTKAPSLVSYTVIREATCEFGEQETEQKSGRRGTWEEFGKGCVWGETEHEIRRHQPE